MSLYRADDEERIRLQALVREWTRSGFLERAQGDALAAELRVDLRRTNVFLRAGLTLFTWLIASAAVGLVVALFDLNGDRAIAMVAGVSAVLCLAFAEYFVRAFRLYRFGVEEALAIEAVGLAALCVSMFTSTFIVGPRYELRDWPWALGLITAAGGGWLLYARFGFVYAAAGGLICAAWVPLSLVNTPEIARALAALIFASGFVVFRSKRLVYGDEFPGDDYSALQAVAWAGVYAVTNLQLDAWSSRNVGPRAYWLTYAAIWILPAIGLWLAVPKKDRLLTAVNLVLAFVTLVTNKPYLGWPRHTWDPILLGVLLAGVALVTRKWLVAGSGGARHGFTASRILERDRTVLASLRTASAAVQPASLVPDAPSTPQADQFGGGRSGGGGAGAGF